MQWTLPFVFLDLHIWPAITAVNMREVSYLPRAPGPVDGRAQDYLDFNSQIWLRCASGGRFFKISFHFLQLKLENDDNMCTIEFFNEVYMNNSSKGLPTVSGISCYVIAMKHHVSYSLPDPERHLSFSSPHTELLWFQSVFLAFDEWGKLC